MALLERGSSARNLLKGCERRESRFSTAAAHVMDVDGLLVDHGAAARKAATDYL